MAIPEDAEVPSGQQLFTDGIRPRWYPRVPQYKVRRLYENDAAGIVDEELIEDVGIGLLLRCRSILIATEAHEGRARCPRCGGMVPHNWDKAATIGCLDCGWQTTWGAYFKTYQGKQLHGGGAVFAFQAYVNSYERAQTPPDRVLLIDQLLHAFHHELIRSHTRPAAANLIEGRLEEVIAFLDELTYGRDATPSVREGGEKWEDKARCSPWVWEMVQKHRSDRPREGD